MRVALATCLLVVVMVTDATNNHGYYRGLDALEEYAYRIANEKMFLREKINTLNQLRGEVEDSVDNLTGQTELLSYRQDKQFEYLFIQQNAIKLVMHALGDAKADLARQQEVLADRQGRDVPVDVLLDDSLQLNQDQTGSLADLNTTLEETNEKLYAKLENNRDRLNDTFNKLVADAAYVLDLANTRHCLDGVVEVTVDPSTGMGAADFYLGDLFEENVPTVFCAIQGFNSHVSGGEERDHGYGYHDERENLAVSVDCNASPYDVSVRVFDQSRALGNSLYTVYVQVKACSFAAQAEYDLL